MTKAEQAAPNVTFLTISSTENSITVTFTDVTQSENENGIEIAYAVGPTASEPTSNWTTAEKINTSTSYNATIDGLSPGTPYIFFARYKEGKYHKPSPPIVSDFVPYTKPKINTTSLPIAYVGVEYSQKPEAVAAEGIAVNWAIFSGSLPAGLTLSSDGIISGTPTAATSSAAAFSVTATIGEGTSSASSSITFAINVIKSNAELGGLTVSGQTGFEGHFQYGDTITVAFTPERKANIAMNALAENTATLTYTNAEGETVTLATAAAQADGSFELTYDTKKKELPIGDGLNLTVSYGGSDALNPAEKSVTVTLDKALLRNVPTITGSYVYDGTLTLNYTPQDDEEVTYQWWRGVDELTSVKINGAISDTYTPTEADVGTNIYAFVSAADDWHVGSAKTDEYQISKAPGDIVIACESVAYGEAVRPIVSSTTNTGADVTFSYAGTGGTSYGPSAAAPTAPGTYTVTATVAETATHAAATSEPVAFSIARPYVPPATPSGPDWGDVADDIAGAGAGGRVVVDMDGETELPGEVLEALAGRDVTLVLQMGEGASWEILGTDVPEGESFSDVDLGVELGTDSIPASVTNLVTGEAGVVQATLAHGGVFGFGLMLVAPLGEGSEGLVANLYHYDEKAGLLRFETSSVVGDDGTARLRLDHASQWAVTLDDRSHELPFPDAAEGEWYSEPLRWAWLSGVVTGYGDGTAGPGRAVTRAEAAAILWNAAGQPETGDSALPADVPAGEWYSAPVAWALDSGVFAGNGDGSFSPAGELTREQAACVLFNRARAAGEDTSARAELSGYADAASVSAWAADAMSWAVAEGVLSGTGGGLLEPGRAIARSELCATLMNWEARE